MKIKSLVYVGLLALAIYSCGNDDGEAGEKPTKEELKASIKVMEDSLKGLEANLKTIKQIPNLTQFELINRLLDFYHNYPEDPYAPECLDKVHMKYTGMNIPVKAAQYADTLLDKYPDYPNRAMVLESQGSTYDISIKPRNQSKVKYYYELLLKENPNMDKEKRQGFEDRLKHIDMTFEQYIDYKMNAIAYE